MSSGIDAVDVRAGYGAIEALHGVTLRFPLGAVVALLGHNGAGKSSLLQVMAGTLPARTGQVLWHGRDITDRPPHLRNADGITAVPDDPNVFLDMTVDENLTLFSHGDAVDAAYAAFPDLLRLRDHRTGTLSGGERQMVALGRIVVRPGSALLLDEVSRGLSASTIQRLYGVLDDLATPDRVIVVVEQYQPDILRRADLIYVLSRGDVAWAGEPGELTNGQLPVSIAG